MADRPAIIAALNVKMAALDKVLKYLKQAGVYGQPEPPPVQVNNFTVVPVERLTDEELDFYLAMAEKGRAVPIDGLTARRERPRYDPSHQAALLREIPPGEESARLGQRRAATS
jgi:hypothetical protein